LVVLANATLHAAAKGMSGFMPVLAGSKQKNLRYEMTTPFMLVAAIQSNPPTVLSWNHWHDRSLNSGGCR
jgi:hypothetical protein